MIRIDYSSEAQHEVYFKGTSLREEKQSS